MVSPGIAKSAVGPIGWLFPSIGKGIASAITAPGSGTPNPPGAPPLPPPATSPTAKPQKKGMQQSFLSGVASAALPGAGAGGAATGKTLLGA